MYPVFESVRIMYLELTMAFSQVEASKFESKQDVELPALSKQAITGLANALSSPTVSTCMFVKACCPLKRQLASLFFVRHESSWSSLNRIGDSVQILENFDPGNPNGFKFSVTESR